MAPGFRDDHDEGEEELFDMLNRELSRSSSLLYDHSASADHRPHHQVLDLFHAAESGRYDIPPSRFEFQLQHQLEQLEMVRMRQDMLQEEMRLMHHFGPNRTIRRNGPEGGMMMRALFIGQAGGVQKAASSTPTGTGVFLPRAHAAQPSKRPPTVLVPERVVHALNQNLERMRNLEGIRYGNDACWI